MQRCLCDDSDRFTRQILVILAQLAYSKECRLSLSDLSPISAVGSSILTATFKHALVWAIKQLQPIMRYSCHCNDKTKRDHWCVCWQGSTAYLTMAVYTTCRPWV